LPKTAGVPRDIKGNRLPRDMYKIQNRDFVASLSVAERLF
jgi:hypothetical protein